MTDLTPERLAEATRVVESAAHKSYTKPQDLRKENAALIVASLDLLDALSAARARVEELEGAAREVLATHDAALTHPIGMGKVRKSMDAIAALRSVVTPEEPHD